MERDLDQSEFGRCRDLVQRLTGIHYRPAQRHQLGNRLQQHMQALGISDYGAYLDLIQRNDQRAELQRFVDSITTNDTFLFRGPQHWDAFGAWVRAAAAAGAHSFRLWSAAAGNGAEACTILIVLEQVLGRGFGGRTVELLGTDVNQQALAEARIACFRAYALSQTPPDVVRTWFRPVAGDRFEFDRRLLRCATFRQHNLLAPMTAPAFDFVFLHNALLWFDAASRERVLGNVHRALRPGGMLTVGENEHLVGLGHGFTYLRPSWFQKPLRPCGAVPPD